VWIAAERDVAEVYESLLPSLYGDRLVTDITP
jgi:hypothetical protein